MKTNNSSIPIGILAIAVLLAGALYLVMRHPSPARAANQKIYESIPTEAGKKNFLTQSANLSLAVDPELVDLDSQIASCDANMDGMTNGSGMSGSCIDSGIIDLSKVKGKYMGGQCCSALKDTADYHDNLKKLQAYKDMPDIVLDPMHTPVEIARKWIEYDKRTTLTLTEQKIFDEAYAISKEKPCCCKCWHYYVNEGIAKKMIKDGTFSAQQIADYWDASDICGS